MEPVANSCHVAVSGLGALCLIRWRWGENQILRCLDLKTADWIFGYISMRPRCSEGQNNAQPYWFNIGARTTKLANVYTRMADEEL